MKTLKLVALESALATAIFSFGLDKAEACTASQYSVATQAKYYATTYITLASHYAGLTGNGIYNSYAQTYWENWNSWNTNLMAQNTKAGCYAATLNFQHYLAQMQHNVTAMQGYISSAQSAAASATISSSTNASNVSGTVLSSELSGADIAQVSDSSTQSTEENDDNQVVAPALSSNRILLVE